MPVREATGKELLGANAVIGFATPLAKHWAKKSAAQKAAKATKPDSPVEEQ